MALAMRLRRGGCKKKPFYKIVVIDSRKKREGEFIEEVGIYNPLKNPSHIMINKDKALAWLKKGVQPSSAVKKLLKISRI